ncbi:MAG: LysM peptidoglycan-binding domain-containing protein [Bacteroidales bacterium]|nr:LysM peptidoglycan-binding domain-containing protein [Bacteroidales bacterium]MBN2819681.1 LysM peptidoglycan-binding domain-containing protein [Bacteroidales bacterium]
MHCFFKKLISLFLLLGLVCFSLEAQFEPAPVKKSKQKVLYQGKVYFVHTVKQNQTLYSISRAYGVTEQDIANANPKVILEVIKPGQVLRIPEISGLQNMAPSYYGLDSDDFIYHVIKSHETVYFLSKKYNVPVEEIYKYNPESKDVLTIGQTIKIPRSDKIPELKEESATEPQQDTSDIYVVKEGDTLYSIAQKYGVSVADFIRTNPDLRWGLKSGMTLIIPGHSPFDNLIVEPEITSINSFIKLYSQKQSDSIKQVNQEQALKLVVLLPYHTKEIFALDSITNDSVKKVHPYNRYKSKSAGYIEFYEGILLAVDSLKRKGYNITLYNYDTKSDTNRVKEIINELNIIRPDLIVGPMGIENVNLISDFSLKHNTPVIHPFTNAAEEKHKENPFSVYMIPDFETEVEISSGYISQFHNKNTIIIYEPDSISIEKAIKLKNSLFAHYASKDVYESTLYKEFKITDSLSRNIEQSLRDDVDNLVVLLSENEANVGNIISILDFAADKKNIQLFGMPKWQRFNNIRIEQIHKLNTQIYSPYFIDYSKQSTKRFINLCRVKLNSEPYSTTTNGSGFNLTYLGYEIGLFFGGSYLSYGAEFINCLNYIKQDLPQAEYSFRYRNNYGFTYNTLNFIKYTDTFTIERIPYTPDVNFTHTVDEIIVPVVE